MKIIKLFTALFFFISGQAYAQDQTMIFAAASMKDALELIVPAYDETSGNKSVVSLASSSVLARQIEAGAPADIFISADKEWMDWLAERNLVKPETISVIAGNSLVIAAAKGTPEQTSADALLKQGRFSMGDPSHVPAGRYGEAALRSLNLWDEVSKNAVYSENVRVALELASRGEVNAAIVYSTDAKSANNLDIVYVFPKDSHPPVEYYAAQTINGKAGTEAFLDFIQGMTSWAYLDKLGFVPPEAQAQ